MKLILDVADDIPLEKMQAIYDGIEKEYKEYIVEMGWIVKGKFVKQLEDKEEQIKKDPYENMLGPVEEKKEDSYENLLGPAKEKKDDPFTNVLGNSEKKDKKDESLGFF